MKIAFNTVLKNLAGEPLTEQVDDKPVEISLDKVAINALLAAFQDERALSGDDKLKRWLVAERISKEDLTKTEITIDELKLIKDLIGKAYAAAIVGPAYLLLGQPAG